MPNDLPPLGEHRHEPRFAIEAGLEFIIGQIAKRPTRRELIHFGVWLALGLCAVAIVGREMWSRYVSACGPA